MGSHPVWEKHILSTRIVTLVPQDGSEMSFDVCYASVFTLVVPKMEFNLRTLTLQRKTIGQQIKGNIFQDFSKFPRYPDSFSTTFP